VGYVITTIDRLNLRGALTLVRRVEVVAPSLLALAELVAGADRIATVHRRLAVRRALSALTRGKLPVEAPDWSSICNGTAGDNDPAVRWKISVCDRQQGLPQESVSTPARWARRLKRAAGSEVVFRPDPACDAPAARTVNRVVAEPRAVQASPGHPRIGAEVDLTSRAAERADERDRLEPRQGGEGR